MGGPEGVPWRMAVREAEGVFGSLRFRRGIIPLNSISGEPGGVFNRDPDDIVGRGGSFGREPEFFFGEHSAELGAVVEEWDERDEIPEAAEVVDEVEAKDCAELEETERKEVSFLSCVSAPSIVLELDLES